MLVRRVLVLPSRHRRGAGFSVESRVVPQRVVEAVLDREQRTLDELVELSRIPSVSAEGFPPEEVARCAAAVWAGDNFRASGRSVILPQSTRPLGSLISDRTFHL